MKHLAAILTLFATPLSAQTVAEAGRINCEIMAHSQIGMDGVPTEALFPSIGEIIEIDMDAGTMAGVGWSDLSGGTVIVQEPSDSGHYVAYSSTGPRVNHSGKPFNNIRMVMVDFASGDASTAPFLATLNGTEVITGICRAAG